MNTAEVKTAIATTEKMILGMPKWRLILYGVLLTLLFGYLAWSLLHKPAPAQGVIASTKPAIAVAKVPGPTLNAPIKILPKAAVRKALPQFVGTPEDTADDEEVVDTAEIPASENGGKTISFIDTTTATVTTKYMPNPSPWFKLEDRNSVGGVAMATTAGAAYLGYAQRDVFRIKDFHVSGVVGAGAIGGKFGAGIGVSGRMDF